MFQLHEDKCADASFYTRLTLIEKEFPGAAVLLHKHGVMPKVKMNPTNYICRTMDIYLESCLWVKNVDLTPTLAIHISFESVPILGAMENFHIKRTGCLLYLFKVIKYHGSGTSWGVQPQKGPEWEHLQYPSGYWAKEKKNARR